MKKLLLILLTLSSLAHAVSDAKKEFPDKAGWDQMAKDQLKAVEACEKIKILGHNFLEISKIIKKDSWHDPCLSNPLAWKKVLESPKISQADFDSIHSSMCSFGSFDPKNNEWCDRSFNDCPVCEMGSFTMMYGEVEGPKKYLENLEIQREWKDRRISFIKKNVLKQESDFSWK